MRIPVHAPASPGHYPKVEELVCSSRISVRLDIGPEVVQNTMFVVWKTPGESMRYIWAGNRSNLWFRPEPFGCELRTLDMVATLRILSDDELFLAGCDVSENCNRLKVREEMIPSIGCPKV